MVIQFLHLVPRIEFRLSQSWTCSALRVNAIIIYKRMYSYTSHISFVPTCMCVSALYIYWRAFTFAFWFWFINKFVILICMVINLVSNTCSFLFYLVLIAVCCSLASNQIIFVWLFSHLCLFLQANRLESNLWFRIWISKIIFM